MKFYCVFFFKQKTAYEMRISDWSSDVCSSDLVWLGTTVENQQQAEMRIPHLLEVPAARHFLSCGPLLGPVDLTHVKNPHGWGSVLEQQEIAGMVGNAVGVTPQVDWVICEGESGPGARPMHPDWARSLRDQ